MVTGLSSRKQGLHVEGCRSTIGEGHIPPCFVITLVMQCEPRRQISCLPASPISTTRRSNSTLLSGRVVSVAALIVEEKSVSVSSHGIVESSSACTSTKRSCE